jgi:hypothetical protein
MVPIKFHHYKKGVFSLSPKPPVAEILSTIQAIA